MLTPDELLAELEAECGCCRKESLPVEARRLLVEAVGLFERINEYLHNLKTETDPDYMSMAPSKGWACGAFREAQRIIDLTVEAFCNLYGLHVPRNQSTGARKIIAVFLLSVSHKDEPRAIGELKSGPRFEESNHSVRRGRHAIRNSPVDNADGEDLVWLRRRVKYPEDRLQEDDLPLEIERALHLARKVYVNYVNLMGS